MINSTEKWNKNEIKSKLSSSERDFSIVYFVILITNLTN